MINSSTENLRKQFNIPRIQVSIMDKPTKNQSDPILYTKNILDSHLNAANVNFHELTLQQLHTIERGSLALLSNQYTNNIPPIILQQEPQHNSNEFFSINSEADRQQRITRQLKILLNTVHFYINQKNSNKQNAQAQQFKKWKLKMKGYILMIFSVGALIVLFLFWRSLKNSKINKIFKLFDHLNKVHSNANKTIGSNSAINLNEIWKPFNDNSFGGFFRIIKKPM